MRKSFWRTGASRRPAIVAAALTAVLVVTLSVPGTPAALADPQRSATQLLAHYKKLSDDAERSSEAMNKAQEQYRTQRAIERRELAAAAAADRSLNKLAIQEAGGQDEVDAVVRASYKGARVNRLYAMLVSDSPQDLLDSMSDLELVSTEANRNLRELRQTQRQLTQERDRARASADRAAKAKAEAAKARSDLQSKQADLQLDAIKVRAVYKSMTGKELAALRGPTYTFDASAVRKGTSPELIAVQAALSKIGSPYVWGATGPSSFDCSGLMMWAFKQAGRTIPRTSEAQNSGGTPVSRDKLAPGDLIIYYSDAHHVGMYVGDGYVIHASTFGVPVAVVPIDKAGPFQAARRY